VKILLLNQSWFAEEFRALGHTVCSVGFHAECDIEVRTGLASLEEAIAISFGVHYPDAIVVYDNSMPLLFTGLENARCKTVFYSVDVHHHYESHRELAPLFDWVLVAQKDYLQHFSNYQNRVSWFPLWSSRWVEPSSEKREDALFIGTLNPKLNPDRVEFFDRLREKVPVTVESGAWWSRFPHAKIVLNQTVRGDLNFRVFEAMISGACLLTEEAPNGLSELFTPNQHLMTYRKGDAEDCAAKIRWLLENEAQCAAIAAAGRDKILSEHTSVRRAKALLRCIEAIPAPLSPAERRGSYGLLLNFMNVAFRVGNAEGPATIGAIRAGIAALLWGMSNGDPLTEEAAAQGMILAFRYEQRVCRGGADIVFRRMIEYAPHLVGPKLGYLRYLRSLGQEQRAEQIAATIRHEDPAGLFAASEQFIAECAKPWLEAERADGA
jgi:Glycosyl transferases group 1